MATAQAVNLQIIVPQNGEMGRRGDMRGVWPTTGERTYFEKVWQAKQLFAQFLGNFVAFM